MKEGGAAGLLNEGGGEQQASCLVAKQAVEFPQVYTSYIYYLHNNVFAHGTVTRTTDVCHDQRAGPIGPN